jgi:hypothetical protein
MAVSSARSAVRISVRTMVRGHGGERARLSFPSASVLRDPPRRSNERTAPNPTQPRSRWRSRARLSRIGRRPYDQTPSDRTVGTWARGCAVSLRKPISFRRSPTSIHTQLQAALSGITLTAFRACAPNPTDESIVIVPSHHSRRGYGYGLTFAHEIARRRFDERIPV